MQRQFLPPKIAEEDNQQIPSNATEEPIASAYGENFPGKEAGSVPRNGLLSRWKDRQLKEYLAEQETLLYTAAPSEDMIVNRSDLARDVQRIDRLQPLIVREPPRTPLHHFPQAALTPLLPTEQMASSLLSERIRAVQHFSSALSDLPLPQATRPLRTVHSPRKKVWIGLTVSVLVLVLLAVGIGSAYYYINFSAPVSHIIGQKVTRLQNDVAPPQVAGSTATSSSILSGGRINILLLGSDNDQKFQSTYLAQTDIVVSIDPVSKTVSMLSIPRDFWLYVPGYGMRKLDEAYGLGGAALSMATIHQDFGIYISHYAWVGLAGFTKVIDTVGGVNIDALHPITDDLYPQDLSGNNPYAMERLYIPAGPQHLDGTTALDYVRSRHADLVGDFGRSVRQQQVLTQLKYKLDNPNILAELPAIAGDLNGYVKTDMQLTDVLALLQFARNIDMSSIQHVVLGPPYSHSGYGPRGDSVVFPNCSLIQPEIVQIFGTSSQVRCDVQANTSTDALAMASASFIGYSTLSPSLPNSAEDSALQVSQQIMSVGSDAQSLMGMRPILDLMCLVVSDNIQALST